MKKLLSALLSLTLVIAVIFSGCAADDNGFESAQQAADNITVGWNLGNTLDSNGE